MSEITSRKRKSNFNSVPSERVNDQHGQDLSDDLFTRNQIQTSCCICKDWTSEGDHHVCCLSCGHVFGFSCIVRWLQPRGRSAKCPLCNGKCSLKDIRKVYLPITVVVNEESHKRIRILEEKCAFLGKKAADLCKKESEWKEREAALLLEVEKLKEVNNNLDQDQSDDVCSRPDATPANNIAVSIPEGTAVPQIDDPSSLDNCITILNEMEGVDCGQSLAALDLFQNAHWRKMFVSLNREKRLTWLKIMLPSVL